MKEHVELRQGAYADSVTLLQVSRTVQDESGVLAAQVAMATPLNLEVLTGMGFTVPDAAPDDLVVALRLDETAELGECLRPSTRRCPARPVRPPPRSSRRHAPRPPRCGSRRRRSSSSRCRDPMPSWRRWTPSTPAAT